MSKQLWLTEGHLESWDLHVEKLPMANAGFFIPNCGWKLTLHTTETAPGSGRGLISNWARGVTGTPHFLLDLFDGREHYTAVQMIDFAHAAKTLEHPAGTKETNKARSVQIEIVEFAKNSPNWSEKLYRALASLAVLIEHQVPIPRKIPRAFSSMPNRYTQTGWINASGINGHQHAASQPKNHWDPGRLRGPFLIKLMDAVDH